jgi:hypothetical protein
MKKPFAVDEQIAARVAVYSDADGVAAHVFFQPLFASDVVHRLCTGTGQQDCVGGKQGAADEAIFGVHGLVLVRRDWRMHCSQHARAPATDLLPVR